LTDGTIAAAGAVISVRGAVVDVRFDDGALPPIDTALVVEWDRPMPLVLEVHGHVDTHTVRGIAMQATAGLSRGGCRHEGSDRTHRCRQGFSGNRARRGTGRTVRSREPAWCNAAKTVQLHYAQFLELESFTRFGGTPD
jgi:F0F1-type ATP synthase beta subunit